MEGVNLFLKDKNYVETEAEPYSFSERLGAAFDLGQKDTFLSNEYEEIINEKLAKGDKIGTIPTEELNQRFTEVEVPFAQPTSFLVANELNEEAKEKKRLMRIITNENTESGWGINLLGQLASHAVDPVEAGADIVLGLTTLGAGKMLTTAAKAGKMGAHSASVLNKIERLRNTNQLTKNIVEGMAANAALEPFFAKSSELMQERYTMSDAFISVVGGGAVFPVAAFGLSKGLKGIVNNAPWVGRAAKGVISQAMSGKRPDLSLFGKLREAHFQAKGKYDANTVRGGYLYKDPDLTNTADRPYYFVRDSGDLENVSNHMPTGDFFGNAGMHVTDSPIRAERVATFDDDISSIDVIEMDHKNLLDLDQPSREFSSILNDPEISKIPEIKEAFASDASLREILAYVKELSDFNGKTVDEVMAPIKEAFKKQGYDGFNYKEHGDSNHIYLFDNAPYRLKENVKPSSKEVPKIDRKILEENKRNVIENKEQDIFFSAKAQKEIEEFVFDEKSMKTYDQLIDDNINTLKELKDQGIADEAQLKELEFLETELELDKIDDATYKALMFCLMKGK